MVVKHLFTKGVSGNPGGKPRVPNALREIHSLSQLEVTKLISKYARMTKLELFNALKNTADLPVLELAIGSVFNHAISKGDYTRLAFLLDRAIGKVPDVMETEEEYDERAELGKLSMKELLTIVKNNLPEELG